MTRPAARPQLLTDLADAVTELVDPSRHTERYRRDRPTTGVVTSTTRRGRVTARRVTRHETLTTTVPSLLDALRHACVPTSSQEQTGASGGAFESRPPLEMDAVAVLRAIRDDTLRWARKYAIDTRQPLPTLLLALVSAPATEDQLANLTSDARRWVRDARLAVGLDAPPITVTASCPICSSRNAIVIHGVGLTEDRQHAKCGRCNASWSPDQLGILAEMLRVNREEEVLASRIDREPR